MPGHADQARSGRLARVRGHRRVAAGYGLPGDPRTRTLTVTPDPGVIEVNVQPAASWRELVEITTTLDTEARACGLATEKFSLDGTHGQRSSIRTAVNAASTRYGNDITTTPYWFKVTRAGNTFTGYSSPDGVTWTEVASPVNIQMNSTIYVGVAVTSCNTSSTIATIFDNVGVIQ